MPQKAVFLDRDNTIIEDKVYLNDPDQIVYLPGAFESLKSIAEAGYKIIIVTNQSGVPRGLVQIPNLNEIHRRIRAEFARHAVDIAGFYYAQFLVESNHRLRKPNPGMLLEATNDHGIDLSQSWMVGDRMTDVEAGHRAGTRSIFLRGSEEPTSIPRRPEFVANDLYEVADFILNCP